MLSVAIVEVIPESVHLAGEGALIYVLVGFFIVHLFEHTIAPHFHFGEETHTEEMQHGHAQSAIFLGLAIHTFFDGVAIASGFLVSTWLGIVIFVAVFLHKLPEGFTVASVVMARSQSKRNAVRAAGLLGAATLAGVLLTSQLQAQLKYALPLSGGLRFTSPPRICCQRLIRSPTGGWRCSFCRRCHHADSKLLFNL